jgi:trehalose synthase
MPNTIPVTPKLLSDYRPIIGDAKTEEILELAKPLKSSRVLHMNATAFGGGVAELLRSLIPMMRDLGIDAQWQVMNGDADFFEVTKQIHNGMQGMYVPWNDAMADTWHRVNRTNAETLKGHYDFVVMHDPQPAGILHYVRERDPSALGARWIWRCHLDTTEALPEVWDFLQPYVEQHEAAIFTRDEYLKEDLQGPMVAMIPPAIDPLSPKNVDISATVVREILQRYNIDPDRPIIAQISRFDPWKDPLGVIDVYRTLKTARQELQLLMVASMADDDPEAWSFYERIVHKAGADFDIHILTNLNGVANLEVNAFQRAAQVVIQKSIREGFGLVISEALWKGKAMVAGEVGGIPMQMLHGHCGRLVSTTSDMAASVRELLDDPQERDRLGALGKEHVRENFLITRLLRDHLRLMNHMASLPTPYADGATPGVDIRARRRGISPAMRLRRGS